MERYYGTHYAEEHTQTQSPYANIKTPEKKSRFVDTHELLKQELILQGGAGGFIADGEPLKDQYRRFEYLTDIADDSSAKDKNKGKEEQHMTIEAINKSLTAIPHIRDNYLYFDSTAKISSISDLAAGKMSWSIPLLNQNQPLENIIEMEIGSFYIPDIPTAATFPQYFFYERITVLLEEVQAQSVRAQNSIRFHWELDLQPAGISRAATPVNPKFIFQIPFRDLSIATFSFRAPIKNTQFQPDIMGFVSQAGTSPARITTNIPHQLAIASINTIYVSNFLSSISIVDQTINDPDGFLVTVINATTLEFPALAVAGFDFAAVGVVQGDLVIGFRRIAFQVRFRTLTDTKTNGITPV